MKSLAALLCLHLAAAAPQSPPAGVAGVKGCKIIPGDAGWPEKATWQSALVNVVSRGVKKGNASHPDYKISAQTALEVQTAVKFAATHNIRLSILNSGHDFLGRLVWTREIARSMTLTVVFQERCSVRSEPQRWQYQGDKSL
jgi:hypothetical protein